MANLDVESGSAEFNPFKCDQRTPATCCGEADDVSRGKTRASTFSSKRASTRDESVSAPWPRHVAVGVTPIPLIDPEAESRLRTTLLILDR